MDQSREQMLRMLEQAKRAIRARTVAPEASGAARQVRTVSMKSKSSNNAPKSTSDDTNALNAKENQKEFVHYYYRLIRCFIDDKSKYELELPNLSGYDRLVVHALAERCNLSHSSSGEGSSRQLRLKKDAMFFQHQEAVKSIDLDDIIAKISGKESKYHLRHARRVDPGTLVAGQVGSYGDDDVLRKTERLRRATDEYRHAVAMGYTQEEMLELEAGEHASIEDILRRPLDDADAVQATDRSLLLSSSPTPATATTSSASPNSQKVFDEMCRSCETRARVDYPISRWGCRKYCAQCTRDTIWSLEEVPAERQDAEVRGHVKGHASQPSHKRHREADGPTAPPAAAVEEIELEEDDPVSAADVMDMVAMNDFSAEDTNWLRFFATRREDNLHERVVFCIHFEDLLELRIFTRYADTVPEGRPEEPVQTKTRTEDDQGTDSDTRVRYVVAREISDMSLKVTSLIHEMCINAFVRPGPADAKAADEKVEEGDVLDHLGLAFLNMSVYGSEATAVCQLRPCVPAGKAAVPHLQVRQAALEELQRRYGEKHFFVTTNLGVALKHAEGGCV